MSYARIQSELVIDRATKKIAIMSTLLEAHENTKEELMQLLKDRYNAKSKFGRFFAGTFDAWCKETIVPDEYQLTVDGKPLSEPWWMWNIGHKKSKKQYKRYLERAQDLLNIAEHADDDIVFLEDSDARFLGITEA